MEFSRLAVQPILLHKSFKFSDELLDAFPVWNSLPEYILFVIVEAKQIVVYFVRGIVFFKFRIQLVEVCFQNADVSLEKYVKLVAGVALHDHSLVLFHSQDLHGSHQGNVCLVGLGLLEFLKELVPLQKIAERHEILLRPLL